MGAHSRQMHIPLLALPLLNDAGCQAPKSYPEARLKFFPFYSLVDRLEDQKQANYLFGMQEDALKRRTATHVRQKQQLLVDERWTS